MVQPSDTRLYQGSPAVPIPGGCWNTVSIPVRGFLSHLDLNVAEPSRSVAFYALVLGELGFEQTNLGADRAIWSLSMPGGAVFAIEVRPPRERPARRRHERYASGIDHLALCADSPDDVDRIVEVVLTAGYPIADPPAEYDYTPGNVIRPRPPPISAPVSRQRGRFSKSDDGLSSLMA